MSYSFLETVGTYIYYPPDFLILNLLPLFAGAQFIVALFSSAPWKTAESNIKRENRLLYITKWSAMKAWNSLSPASMLVINATRTF